MDVSDSAIQDVGAEAAVEDAIGRWEGQLSVREASLRRQMADLEDAYRSELAKLTAAHDVILKKLQWAKDSHAVLGADPRPPEEVPPEEVPPVDETTVPDGYQVDQQDQQEALGDLPEPFRAPDLATLRGLSQLDIMRRIADLNDGYVRIVDAKRIVSELGAAKATGRNLSSSLNHRLRDADDFEWIGAGVYRRRTVAAHDPDGPPEEANDDVEA